MGRGGWRRDLRHLTHEKQILLEDVHELCNLVATCLRHDVPQMLKDLEATAHQDLDGLHLPDELHEATCNHDL